MKKIVLLGLLAAALSACADSLENGFREVPMPERPWCYYWWVNGNVDTETITRDLEAMRRIGFGGILLFDARGYHEDVNHLIYPKPKMAFMSDTWRDMVKHTVREAARLGLTVSVNLSSCAGALKGPWAVGADAPKRLVYQLLPLSDTMKIPARDVPGLKHFQDIASFIVVYKGAALPATDGWKNAGDGPIDGWSGKKLGDSAGASVREAVSVQEVMGENAPALAIPEDCHAALLRFGYAVIDGHEYDVDILDARAVEGHFNRMGKTLLDDVGALAGKTLTHFYNVSWEGAVPSWTPSFEADFQRLRGYAVRPWLPVLAGFRVQSDEQTTRFVTDYRRTRNECFLHNFYGTMVRLSHQHGIQWHSESGGPWHRAPNVFGEADQLAFLGINDMPQGEFWYTGASDRRGRQLSRPQAITAHIYGRRLAAAEAFTHMVRHWTPYPALLKRSGDECFIDGVNHLIWHTFTCSPQPFGKPGIEYFAGTHINPNVTWFEQAAPFITYLGRCQHLLQRGLFVADVAAYVGDLPYQHWGRFTTNWNAKATLTLPTGYGYDILNNEVLLTRVSVKDGRITLPDGMSYRLLAVDFEDERADPSVLRKIVELRQAGATVLLGARRPTRVAGQKGSDDEVKRLVAALWGEIPTPTSTSVADALKALKLTPDFEGPFEYTHRRDADADTDIYFLLGSGQAACTFRVSGRQPELWDAVSGTIKAVPFETTSDGRTRLTLDLPEHGSTFVVFRKNAQRSTLKPEARRQKPEAIPLSGSWDVAFQPGRGTPEKVVFAKLIDWSTHSDPGIRHFSGTATYRKTFEVTAEQAGRAVVLNLGTVAAIAQVRLNGKDLGVVWTAPWQAEVTGALKAGTNELEIEVTNTWANRLVGDAALPPEKRVTQSNMALRHGPRQGGEYVLRQFAGFSSEDTLQPSGLMGPVTLSFSVQ
ncbi:MAG TPA: glycosyl hydrolase [Kiritimatiellia bacterium]|nr:glycosyl hydrolase [Kiritimatiellia bacterium]